jgi:hypothetical protein
LPCSSVTVPFNEVRATWALMLTEPRRDRRRILTRKFMSVFWETA